MNKQLFNKYYKKVADADDNNGVLSEYVIMYLMFHCNHLCFISVVFRVFDTNQDGTIDFGEFVMAVASQTNKDLDSQLDLSFAM